MALEFPDVTVPDDGDRSAAAVLARVVGQLDERNRGFTFG